MSLIRLRHQQASERGARHMQHESHEKLNEAHSMLSEVYHWLTEGFDTVDPKARELLAELSHRAIE